MRIYHNPRCMKSRQTLQLIQDQGIEPEVIKYLDDPLSPDQLREILDLLGIQPMDLVRNKEKIWKEEYAGKELDDDEIILAMAENPKLIERPIVVKGKKAVLGRPPENVRELF